MYSFYVHNYSNVYSTINLLLSFIGQWNLLVNNLPHSSYSFYSSNRFSEILEKLEYVEFTEEAIGKMFVGWYAMAAYLYQARSLLKTKSSCTHLKNGN
ncbi:hypothetical protein CSQ79_16740 [Gloeocapsopsis sp. IPPAS B-1203]|nr:hypothetical protein CSQ79_16740 [Gloeocapsopsis sp. IPPAS B-1203]